MSDIAIRVEGLGKRFRLRPNAPLRTLREDLVALPKRMADWFSREQSVTEDFWALRDMSFEVKRGEVFGIIGRNGAGKSTLLKILTRIMAPTTGVADLYGRVGSLLEVGTGFHPELNGRENIYMSGAMLGMRRHEVKKRFDEIVAFAEVERFVDTPCKHYSTGMFMRLGFAVAAHLDARILLVDEVLAVGDVEFQRKCLGKMGEVSQSGKTVLLVSHDLEAIRRLAHQCIWMDGGVLARSGPTADVIDAYLKAAVESENQQGGEVTFEHGKQGIWFSRACLTGSNGDTSISMGDSVTLAFEVRADENCANKPVCFTIGLRTEEGVPVALVADFDSGFRLNRVGRSNRIRVRFDNLKLYPGRYFLRLWAGSHDGLETYDDRQDCMMLYIADPGKLSQRRLLRSQGVYFFQPEWTIET